MMDDYISREAALMKLMQDGCSAKNLQSILDMPAADVAEVMRCKDCKYGVYASKPNSAIVCLRTNGSFWRKETDFCSYGEYQTNTGGSNNVAD